MKVAYFRHSEEDTFKALALCNNTLHGIFLYDLSWEPPKFIAKRDINQSACSLHDEMLDNATKTWI